MSDPSPASGYAFECKLKRWRGTRDESWIVVMLTPGDRQFEFLGERVIDDRVCLVWRCKSGEGSGYFYAQTKHNL